MVRRNEADSHHAVIKLDFSTITPSPPVDGARHYPFAPSANLSKADVANSPTSPLKKGGFLSRLPKHRALARVSNPLLSAAYKLGEQQANMRGSGLLAPGDSKNTAKTARRVSTSSIGGADSRFERDFVLLGPIGVGEFSTVWKVREKRNGTVWAVKRGKPYIGEKDRLVAHFPKPLNVLTWPLQEKTARRSRHPQHACCRVPPQCPSVSRSMGGKEPIAYSDSPRRMR